MQTIARNLAVAAMALCAAAACAQQSQNMEAMNRGVFSDVPAPPLGGSVKDAAAKKRGSLQPGTGDFYRFAKIEATPVSQEASPMDLRRWTLSALVSKATGEVEFYLHYYEIYRASSWKAFSAAQTDAGENLKLGRIGARVVSCRSGCSYAEELFIDLAPGTVERARTQPLRIQLSGLGANATLVEVGAQAVNDLVAKAELEAMKYRKAGASAGVGPALASEPSMPAAATPALVADELQKLARLRADGTITEQEFQGLKAKLLAR